MDAVPVVTCFLRHEGRILLLRRSESVGSYPGTWGAVAGHVASSTVDPEHPIRDPLDAALAEIREETGIDDATLVRRGERFAVTDADRGTRWLVHPFLFDVDTTTIEPNEETAAVEWVHAPAIRSRETVPDLWESYERVRPRVEVLAEDTSHGAAYLSVRALEVLRDEAALAADGEDSDGCERRGNDWDGLAALARELLDARPSMAVVANRVNRAMNEAAGAGTPGAVERAARDGIDRAVRVDDDAAAVAADELPGRVATLSRSGTVRAAIEGAAPATILVAESRPGGEGVGVAESLAASCPDADVTLTSDAAMAHELDARDAEAVLVGADRIRPDGSVVNKVGTRAAALAAPADCAVFVVASTDKVATDDAVDLEPRDPAELYDGDAPLSVTNPTFDVTPADAVDGILTERGRLSPDEIADVAAEHRERATW